MNPRPSGSTSTAAAVERKRLSALIETDLKGGQAEIDRDQKQQDQQKRERRKAKTRDRGGLSM